MAMFSRFRFRNYSDKPAFVEAIASDEDGNPLGSEAVPIQPDDEDELLDPSTRLEGVRRIDILMAYVDALEVVYEATLEIDEDFTSGEAIIVPIEDAEFEGFVAAVTEGAAASKTAYLAPESEGKSRPKGRVVGR